MLLEVLILCACSAPTDPVDGPSITISSGPSQVLVGQTARYEAKVRLKQDRGDEGPLVWTSSDESIARIAFDGGEVIELAGVSPGRVKLRATAQVLSYY